MSLLIQHEAIHPNIRFDYIFLLENLNNVQNFITFEKCVQREDREKVLLSCTKCPYKAYKVSHLSDPNPINKKTQLNYFLSNSVWMSTC